MLLGTEEAHKMGEKITVLLNKTDIKTIVFFKKPTKPNFT